VSNFLPSDFAKWRETEANQGLLHQRFTRLLPTINKAKLRNGTASFKNEEFPITSRAQRRKSSTGVGHGYGLAEALLNKSKWITDSKALDLT
jgi:hypothetical protein